jgi:hypothetical protein
VDVRVPLLPGALVVKAAAATDPRTQNELRHAQDVAALLSIIDSPEEIRVGRTATDLSLLARLNERLRNVGDSAWATMPAASRREGQAALRTILSGR